jgi:hypothetical protein
MSCNFTAIYDMWLLNNETVIKMFYCKVRYSANYLLQSSYLGHLHNAACIPIVSGSISENYVKALSASVSFFLDDDKLKMCSFQRTFKQIKWKEIWRVRGKAKYRNSFFSHTAKLIQYCAVGCCAGAESSHSPTTPAFLQILS